jgi:hypothetical protein
MTWQTDLQSIFTAAEIEQGRYPVGYVATGEITGRETTVDEPWAYAMLVIRCPDGLSIRHTATAQSKAELPKIGEQVTVKKTAFAWEVFERK